MSFERGPYLNLAAFCEKVIESKDGALSLINVVDRLTVTVTGANAPEQMPPQILPWTLVLSFKSGDIRGSREVKIIPELPSGFKNSPATITAHFEGGTRGANLILQSPLRLEQEGIFWFWVYVDGEFMTKVPIEVVYSRLTFPTGPART